MIDLTHYSETIFPTLSKALISNKDSALSVLIVDGIVASGKSTFTNMFKDYLEEQSQPTIILRADWFLTFQENRMPPHLIILTLFLSSTFGADSGIVTKHLSTFFETGEIDDIISRINLFQTEAQRAKNLTIQIENKLRHVNEKLTLTPTTCILIEGVFSSNLFHQLQNSQTLMVYRKTSAARRLFFERAKRKHFNRVRIFVQSVLQIPPSYAGVMNKQSSKFDYILDMNHVPSTLRLQNSI
jgi:uridine kinase